MLKQREDSRQAVASGSDYKQANLFKTQPSADVK